MIIPVFVILFHEIQTCISIYLQGVPEKSWFLNFPADISGAGNLGHSGPLWATWATLGHFWPLGPLWATLGHLGHFGPPGPPGLLWATLGHFGPL